MKRSSLIPFKLIVGKRQHLLLILPFDPCCGGMPTPIAALAAMTSPLGGISWLLCSRTRTACSFNELLQSFLFAADAERISYLFPSYANTYRWRQFVLSRSAPQLIFHLGIVVHLSNLISLISGFIRSLPSVVRRRWRVFKPVAGQNIAASASILALQLRLTMQSCSMTKFRTKNESLKNLAAQLSHEIANTLTHSTSLEHTFLLCLC